MKRILGVTTARGTVVKGRSIRKGESHHSGQGVLNVDSQLGRKRRDLEAFKEKEGHREGGVSLPA